MVPVALWSESIASWYMSAAGALCTGKLYIANLKCYRDTFYYLKYVRDIFYYLKLRDANLFGTDMV